MNRIWLNLSTFFNVGRIPIAPGTWASLVTAACLFIIHPYIHSPVTEIAALIFITAAGIPAAAYAEKYFGRQDPSECVIDEVAGQMLCLILLPYSFIFYLAAFLAFRFFDILKPFPIRRIERIGGGLGIMLDDLIAALYSAGLIHLIILINRIVF